ncbi:glycosyltransferase family 4 protein [Halorientalis halophila]|uniref:glycosyltransferase family 4 protein n=1 Tax=Halorientalis halophila TaxID=3108499 RepID=UPI00300A4C41
MADSLKVHFFTLTDTEGSEHIYMGELQPALAERNVVPVDDWRDADVVHLFEVNFLTADTLRNFQFPKLLRIIRSDTSLVISTDDLYFCDDPDLTVRPRLYPLNHHLQRLLFERADALIAISESVRGRLERHVDSTPIHVVRHGVDDAYRNDDTPSGDPFVLHVSLAAPRKNPEAVAEVAERLDHRMVIAGSGWDERIPETATNVETPGFVPEDELIRLYEDAAVFYFPTRHEGFGLPVLEAMAANTAVVTSDVYSVPEVTGEHAVLRNPHAIDAHVEAIERLLETDAERRELAQQAHERAEQFTWAKAARETESVYRDVRV